MAKTVFKTETIELLDGSTVNLRPLNIKNMKKFQKSFSELQEGAANDTDASETLDGLLGLAAICLAQDNPDVADLEECLDLDSVYKIIEICAGVKLNDPNLVAAATAMLADM